MGDSNEEELYKRQQMDEALRVQMETAKRAQELEDFRKAEEARKAAEEAAKGKMVADPEEAAPNWPDNGFQAAPQTGVDRLAGALRVGQAGDVAFARDLLNSGQAPLGAVSKAEPDAAGAKDGAHDSGAGARAPKPSLGLG
ncbi:hypothetical protein GCM10009804_45570 [Kribbella hippodromi]|uniref:Uncharacterized protein n=1 Tax=Kribbella hippodromi TaxID=434347 RepID=A0ABN2DR49_9ACTN